MNYEQKYKEAMSFLKDLRPHMSDYCKEKIDGFFPELRESEDERIRKELIAFLESKQLIPTETKNEWIAWLEKQKEFVSADFDDVWETADCEELTAPLDKYSKDAIKKMCHAWYDKGIELERRNWFEKQGEQILANSCKTCKDEQKPSWSEEDERMLSGLISIVEGWYNTMSEEEKEYYGDCGYINWINSIKDRVQLQQKQEWSEEDKQMIRSILCYLNEFGNWLSDKNEEKSVSIYKAADWLKSLKPNHWKPSEEQMKALKTTIHISNFGLDIDRLRMLESLYNDLKKL